LAPANVNDLEVGFEMLCEHTDLSVLGDKAYISANKAAELFTNNRIRLMTLPRRNQKAQLPAEQRIFLNGVRQMIETVNLQNFPDILFPGLCPVEDIGCVKMTWVEFFPIGWLLRFECISKIDF
jgi:hypothetical protein